MPCNYSLVLFSNSLFMLEIYAYNWIQMNMTTCTKEDDLHSWVFVLISLLPFQFPPSLNLSFPVHSLFPSAFYPCTLLSVIQTFVHSLFSPFISLFTIVSICVLAVFTRPGWWWWYASGPSDKETTTKRRGKCQQIRMMWSAFIFIFIMEVI